MNDNKEFVKVTSVYDKRDLGEPILVIVADHIVVAKPQVVEWSEIDDAYNWNLDWKPS